MKHSHHLSSKNIFLDSGAFSAYTRGVKIDIHEYIAFIKKHRSKLRCYANLDVIGDVEGTWKNQKIMEDAGLNPLPVFHSTDPWKYLDRCLEYDYFALGGLASDCKRELRMNFLDTCFGIICDTPDRLPKSKVHAFGVTDFSLLNRYPFYSCDSTRYLFDAGYGEILIPKNKEDWSSLSVFRVSNVEARTMTNLSSQNPEILERVRQIVKHESFDFEELKISREYRVMWNIHAISKICETMKKWPWPYFPKRRSLF